jgi:hypothetical protein
MPFIMLNAVGSSEKGVNKGKQLVNIDAIERIEPREGSSGGAYVYLRRSAESAEYFLVTDSISDIWNLIKDAGS